jgi:hypothetical protein
MRTMVWLLCLLTGASLSHCDFGAAEETVVSDGLDAGAAGDRPNKRMDAASSVIDAKPKPVRPAPCTVEDYDLDDDGLQADFERDAGFDPCQPDTDSDGCNDSFEFFFGGCDPRNALATLCAWHYKGLDGTVQFRAPPRDGGSWSRLNLRSDRKGLRIWHESAGNSGVQAGADGFIDVPAGTELTFSVRLDDPRQDERVDVTLVDERGQVLDRGTVVFLSVDCPIVI